jgi:hypothetical protein
MARSTNELTTAAHAKFELDRAAAYRDFYRELEALGRLSVAEAIGSKPPYQSRFERACWHLCERIIVAGYKRLTEAGTPESVLIRSLAEHTEYSFDEIYMARLSEFAERASLHTFGPLDIFLALVPMNARQRTSKLFRQLEDEILLTNPQERVSAERGMPPSDVGGGIGRHKQEPLQESLPTCGVNPRATYNSSGSGQPQIRGPGRPRESKYQLGVVSVLDELDPWEDKDLGDVCERLDEAGISIPKAWEKRQWRSWLHANASDPALAKKILRKYYNLHRPR